MDFQCPYCKKEYSREKDALGKTVRCKCGKSFVIHEKAMDAEEFEGEEGVEYEVFKEDILNIGSDNSSEDDLSSDFPERITFVGGKQKKEVLDFEEFDISIDDSKTDNFSQNGTIRYDDGTTEEVSARVIFENEDGGKSNRKIKDFNISKNNKKGSTISIKYDDGKTEEFPIDINNEKKKNGFSFSERMDIFNEILVLCIAWWKTFVKLAILILIILYFIFS